MLMPLIVMTIAGTGTTVVNAGSKLKTATADDFSFSYPSSSELQERENRFTSVSATLELKKDDTIGIQFEAYSPDVGVEMNVDTLETVLTGMYDSANIFESGEDKYLINNKSAPYAIATYSSENIFGYSHDYVVMAILINLGNDDYVIGQYITTQDDFDNYLDNAEQIFQSVRPVSNQTASGVNNADTNQNQFAIDILNNIEDEELKKKLAEKLNLTDNVL
jgi:hypothetical protein